MAESDLYMQCDEDDLEPCQSFTENRNQIYNKGNLVFFYCKYKSLIIMFCLNVCGLEGFEVFYEFHLIIFRKFV